VSIAFGLSEYRSWLDDDPKPSESRCRSPTRALRRLLVRM